MAQPRWMLVRGILGSGRTGRVSSRPFPNSSGWWWLISSIFLIRIFCHKTTHANGYYGAWPGWAVSISVLPLTTSWQADGEKMEIVADFIFLGSKITVDSDCSHEIKRHVLLGRKTMTDLDSIFKKQRHHFSDKGPCSQSYGFSSSHLQM